MLLFLVTFLCIQPSTITMYLLLGRLLPIRRKKLLLCIVMVWGNAIWIINNYLMPSPLAALDIFSILTAFLITTVFVAPPKRLIGFIYRVIFEITLLMTDFVVAVLVLPVARRMGYDLAALTTVGYYPNAVMSLIVNCLGSLALFGVYRLMKRWQGPEKMSLWMLLYLAVPTSQFILLNLSIRLLLPSDQYETGIIVLALGFLFCIAADVGLFISIRKIQQGQKLQAHMRMVEEQLNTQTSYYRQLQENILTINQIRHDLNNQLQTAYRLLDQGESDLVRQQLDVLQSSLRDRVGPRWCANLIVDAILSDKARLCRERGIRLEISTDLPADLPIESTHLCSVFSNLLDNAIQGVLDSGSEDKYIDLRTNLHQEYLTVHCINPAKLEDSRQASRDPLRAHGLGLEILERLAKQYQGSMSGSQRGGIFEATLILRFRRQPEDPKS